MYRQWATHDVLTLLLYFLIQFSLSARVLPCSRHGGFRGRHSTQGISFVDCRPSSLNGGGVCGIMRSAYFRIIAFSRILSAFSRIFPHNLRISPLNFFLPLLAKIDRFFFLALENYVVRIFLHNSDFFCIIAFSRNDFCILFFLGKITNLIFFPALGIHAHKM